MSMNHVMEVQRRTVSVVNGEQQESFTSIGTYFANATKVASREATGDDLENIANDYRIVFRRNDATEDIGSGYRLSWERRLYDVIEEPDLADRFYVTVVARQRKPAAR